VLGLSRLGCGLLVYAHLELSEGEENRNIVPFPAQPPAMAAPGVSQKKKWQRLELTELRRNEDSDRRFQIRGHGKRDDDVGLPFWWFSLGVGA